VKSEIFLLTFPATMLRVYPILAVTFAGNIDKQTINAGCSKQEEI
jgi:hypothetical protein